MKKKYIREGGIVQFWNNWAEGGQIDFQKLGDYIMNPPKKERSIPASATMADEINEDKKVITDKEKVKLREAISHCQDVIDTCNNDECALEHKLLMMWLQELQCLRKVVDKKYLKGIAVLKDAYGDRFPHYFDIELRRDLTGMFAE